MQGWIESDLFEIWIKEEFIETYPDIKKEDKVLAFQEIAKLVAKMLTRKIESKAEITETRKVLHLHLWKPETVDSITSRQ